MDVIALDYSRFDEAMHVVAVLPIEEATLSTLLHLVFKVWGYFQKTFGNLDRSEERPSC